MKGVIRVDSKLVGGLDGRAGIIMKNLPVLIRCDDLSSCVLVNSIECEYYASIPEERKVVITFRYNEDSCFTTDKRICERCNIFTTYAHKRTVKRSLLKRIFTCIKSENEDDYYVHLSDATSCPFFLEHFLATGK